MIEDFFHLPLVSTTPVVHLELRISPRIFEKIRNGPNGYSGARGKLIHEKNCSFPQYVQIHQKVLHKCAEFR
jgi:hypothetical protein